MDAAVSIRPMPGTWVVRAGGAVLGETSNALLVSEPNHADVVYFPRADLAMAFLEPSAKRTSSANMGEAAHFSIVTKSQTIADAAFSYEAPSDPVAQIAGHLAFYPSDLVAVEEL